MIEYKATKKLGTSLVIFAVLTARTLYTYKYEVAVNNDKLHRPASAFYPWILHLGMSPSVGSAWAPVRVSPGEAHLSGRPADTLPPLGTSCPVKVEDTCPCGRRRRWWTQPGLAGFFIRSRILAVIPFWAFPACPDDCCWLILDFSYGK